MLHTAILIVLFYAYTCIKKKKKKTIKNPIQQFKIKLVNEMYMIYNISYFNLYFSYTYTSITVPHVDAGYCNLMLLTAYWWLVHSDFIVRCLPIGGGGTLNL